MSRQDFEKWQGRYAERSVSDPEEVEPFLKEIEAELPSLGRALDLAGGVGRNAIFFARRGLQVTLEDVSPRGLDLASATAERVGVEIDTCALDLEVDALPEGPFDLVVCTWFLLTPEMWRAIASALAPSGRVVYVQPTTRHLERHAHPPARFLVEFEHLASTLGSAGLEPLRLEQGWDSNGAHTARVLARKASRKG